MSWLIYLQNLGMGAGGGTPPAPFESSFGLVDPDAARLIPSVRPPIVLVTGSAAELPIQCYLRGDGTVPATFAPDDVLTTAIYASRQAAAAFVPTVGLYTLGGTQDGYEEGQVVVTFTSTQGAILVPTISFNLLVWRARAVDPTNRDLVVRIPLVVEPLA